MSSARVTGKCKWFDRKKGYGFVEVEGQPDVFVHQTEIRIEGFRALYPEQEVEFVIKQSGPKGRPCATEVTGVGGDELRSQAPRGRGRGRGAGRGGRGGGRGGRGEGKTRNSAFVFIKPHALTDKVKTLVEETLKSKGITILKQGSLDAKTIDEKQLIDQHYYAIASKATILKPKDLPVPEDLFEKTFGLSWKKALDSKVVFNAMDACKELKVSAAELDKLWAAAKANKKLVKFGGGFYCGKVEQGKKAIYVFNGFFMAMRSKFTAPGTSIHYYVVQWDADQLSWADFRGKVLGPTDPAEAPKDSLRGLVLATWKDLGLKEQPNVGDNAVHASASPFEALAERMNWLGVANASEDPFGKALLTVGVSDETIKKWSVDPQVPLPGGEKGSLFDTLEDLDAEECLAKCAELAKL